MQLVEFLKKLPADIYINGDGVVISLLGAYDRAENGGLIEDEITTLDLDAPLSAQKDKIEKIKEHIEKNYK